ncbi:uncharacterized protein LOC127705711 isoform X2 [Mytilus californianus]|uniref:uncharacterized protein LOC127705711 isoform X2 n=1 Tax=Mytilus californianus TaxID=6549 RepID=UPI00224807AA|nr:uncharacterized protein LOC127705711 isoform X2 [Mytilus californianus]
MAESETEDPIFVSGKNGKLTFSGKGTVEGGPTGVKIEVSEIGTTLEFKTDFEGQTHYKSGTPIEEYKSNTYEFIRGRGNPEVNLRKDGYSYITLSLTKIKA